MCYDLLYQARDSRLIYNIPTPHIRRLYNQIETELECKGVGIVIGTVGWEIEEVFKVRSAGSISSPENCSRGYEGHLDLSRIVKIRHNILMFQRN